MEEFFFRPWRAPLAASPSTPAVSDIWRSWWRRWGGGAGREGSYCLERNGRPRCLYEPAVHPVKRVVDQRPLIESGFQRAARNGIGWRFSVKVIVAARAASFLPTQLVIIVADSRSSSRIEFLKLNCFYDNLSLT